MTAVRLNEALPIDGLAAPILAFDQNVGADAADNPLRARIVEHDDVADHLERGDQSGAIGRVVNRTIGALDRTYAAIAVEADDQHVAVSARETQYLQMAGMQ